MAETWAEKAEREQRARRELRRAETATTWAERTECEQRAKALHKRGDS